MTIISLFPSNNTSSAPGQFIYQSNVGPLSFNSKSKIALSKLSLNYSWRNVTVAYNNNSISYKWLGTSYVVSINDGCYSIDDISSTIQNTMKLNGHYLLNTTTNVEMYFLTLASNTTFSGIQLTCIPIPTTMPTGFSLPSNAVWALPSTAQTPQLVVPSTNISTLLGYTAGIYPPSTISSEYQTLSTSPPVLFPVQSIQVLCNCVVNRFNPNMLYSFQPSGIYDSLIQIEPVNKNYIQLSSGDYTQMTFTLVDQNGVNLVPLDNYFSLDIDII